MADAEPKPESIGRNDRGTLWDTDKATDTLKAIVEEAKINICIRLVKDYKMWIYSNPSPNVFETCAQQYN